MELRSMTLDGTFDQNNVINQLLQNESFVDVITLITGKPDQSLHMYSVLFMDNSCHSQVL